ncbi:hypothetical protein [Paenibacillus solani]|uniref:hypothetical protein n=1 Tax=Paenibacillus solani TaxID=1705565 RepID=UPI00103E8A61|nr:hypothetical protein [Paenibacillus solani]
MVVYISVIIRLIYHYRIALSFESVSLVALPVLLLLLILYLISRTSWSKLYTMHYWIAGIIGVFLIGFSIYALSDNQSQQRFDYNRWVGYPDQRAIMVDDFLQKYDLIGLTHTEVMNRLGANDNAKRVQDDEGQVVYDLGSKRRTDYTNERLIIYFDERGYVKNYEILPK